MDRAPSHDVTRLVGELAKGLLDRATETKARGIGRGAQPVPGMTGPQDVSWRRAVGMVWVGACLLGAHRSSWWVILQQRRIASPSGGIGGELWGCGVGSRPAKPQGYCAEGDGPQVCGIHHQ